MKARLALAALTVGGLLAGAAPASAAGTLDQKQETIDNYDGADNEHPLAQTFTAGLTGNLDQIDLNWVGGNTGPAVSIEIRPTADGKPTNVVLASPSVPAASVPNAAPAWVSIPIPPVAVTAGTRAFSLEASCFSSRSRVGPSKPCSIARRRFAACVGPSRSGTCRSISASSASRASGSFNRAWPLCIAR